MHELEQFDDGSTAFVAGHQQDAWHRLGTVLPAGLTACDVMTYAHLGGWDVRKREISTVLASTDHRPVAQVPLITAVRVEIVKQHDGQPSRDHREVSS